jgi:ergothioneine biosynthesis protein EgtB
MVRNTPRLLTFDLRGVAFRSHTSGATSLVDGVLDTGHIAITDCAALRRTYRAIRARTEHLAAPLSAEDQTVQSMPDASPTKWHRAHTSWFFETFVLAPLVPTYAPFHPQFGYLFNSYYEAVGERHPRAARGVLARPSGAEITAYRTHVDDAMEAFFSRGDATQVAAPLIVLGCHHEEQHQELILTDILHAFAANPLQPAYRARAAHQSSHAPAPLRWHTFAGGLTEIGAPDDGFAFDNERPRHSTHVAPFRLASRLATNGEWRAFMADGGYDRADLWLADGWAQAQTHGWHAPLYWCRRDDAWMTLTLNGAQPVDDTAPVCHVSYYEADAFARWTGKRLPTEAEWETAAATVPIEGNLLETGLLQPEACAREGLQQMFGDVWEWTQSAYAPYPGFKPLAGAAGEYNGKFMINQMVLRGGACITPAGHIRRSYRNFFYPHMRWQFAGVRLAEDA